MQKPNPVIKNYIYSSEKRILDEINDFKKYFSNFTIIRSSENNVNDYHIIYDIFLRSKF